MTEYDEKNWNILVYNVSMHFALFLIRGSS